MKELDYVATVYKKLQTLSEGSDPPCSPEAAGSKASSASLSTALATQCRGRKSCGEATF